MHVSGPAEAPSSIDAESVSTRLDAVRRQIRQLQSDTDRIDGEGASRLLREVTAATSELESLRLRLVSRIRETEVWRSDPNGTPNSWLRTQHHLDYRGAESDLRAADALQNYPEIRKAAEDGELTRAHVDAIVGIGEANDIRKEHLANFVELFVDVGKSNPPSVLKKVMRAWADQIDPLGTAGTEEAAHKRRYFNVKQGPDGVTVEGFFGHEQGARLMAALNAALSKGWREGLADKRTTARDRNTLGSDADDGSCLPSTSQQRADAFITGIVGAALANGDLPTNGGSRPTVTVLVPLERLEREREASSSATEILAKVQQRAASGCSAAESFESGSATIGVTNGPGSALVSAQAAQRLTCDCEVHRILLSPDGLPLDVGRSMRTFPPHLRKALAVRDKGCVFPGCGRPPGWAEAHHIVHWAQGGRTSLENSALLCSKHHHQVHSEGHIVEIGPDGRGRVVVAQTRRRE